jgi:AAA15 family ATPase/GTPase
MIGEHKELPNSYPVKLLEDIFYDLLERNVEIKIEGTGVNFTEKGMTLSFDQLSEGYKSILIFVSDLLYRLSKNSKGDEKITNLKGIVLVDEIDLHLHPKWQRLIVNKLRTIFPNIQFVFTTHSPMIIQGASPDAIIFRVYRNKEDGITRVSEPYFRKKLDHLMINTVLTSPLFGMIDSRMDSKDDFSDTSETYLLYKIDKKIKLELEKQKAKGKEFVSDAEIDRMIDDILKEELGND